MRLCRRRTACNEMKAQEASPGPHQPSNFTASLCRDWAIAFSQTFADGIGNCRSDQRMPNL